MQHNDHVKKTLQELADFLDSSPTVYLARSYETYTNLYRNLCDNDIHDRGTMLVWLEIGAAYRRRLTEQVSKRTDESLAAILRGYMTADAAGPTDDALHDVVSNVLEQRHPEATDALNAFIDRYISGDPDIDPDKNPHAHVEVFLDAANL